MSDTGHSSRPDADCKRWNVDSLHLYFERWLVLLEKQYDGKFFEIKEATDKALVAVRELTAAAFAANKEAVFKTEEAQKAYNAQHNDLTRKMETQANQFVGREKLDDVEKAFDAKLAMIKADIARLQEGILATGVRRESQQEHRATAQWTAGQIISTLIAIIGFGLAIVAMVYKSSHP